MKDVVKTLLCLFPETDIKKSIYNELTNTLIIDNEKISKISGNDETSGNIQEQTSIIYNLIKLLNNSIDTLCLANRNNHNNDNNNDVQQRHDFLNATLDGKNNILKIDFQNNKSIILNEEMINNSINNNKENLSTIFTKITDNNYLKRILII